MQAFSRTLKRPGPVVDEPSTKRSKSPEAPTSSMLEVPISPAVTSPPSSRTRTQMMRILLMRSGLLLLDRRFFLLLWVQLMLFIVLMGDLQVLFDSQAGGKVSGEVLSMFTDVSYPLSVKLIKKMLMHKLEIDSDFMGNDLTIAEQLIQFIKNQIELASPEQTATSKDILNPFMAVMIWQKIIRVADFLRTLFKNKSLRYVVPTGRVIVPTGRYIVPTSRVIVPTSRYVVPAGKEGIAKVEWGCVLGCDLFWSLGDVGKKVNSSGNGGIQGAHNAGVQSGGNQNGLVVVSGIANQNETGNVVAARAEEEFDIMAAAGDLDEIEEVNANCILMANLQHASTYGTQLDKAPVYETDGSAKKSLTIEQLESVHLPKDHIGT
nr:hypothetical protein [Tanacetum cinerariifolium]